MPTAASITRSSALRLAVKWAFAVAIALVTWLAPGQAAAQNLCVGNLVYVDGNGNGVYDFNEGVGNVRVEIWRATGDLETPYVMAATLQTQSSGFYLFQGLQAGSYFVTIPASEFGPSKPLQGMLSLPGAALVGDDDASEDGQDSFDPSSTGISSVEFEVSPNFGPTGAQESGFAGTVDDNDDANGDMTVDFGFYRPVGVGNLVFSDNNSNGIADPGEGIPGIVVQLFKGTDDPQSDAPVTDLITDVDGFFFFGGQTPGDYKLHIPAWQFQEGGALEGAVSVAGVGLSGDDDNATGAGHSGDNGVDDINPAMNGITSGVVSLQPGTSPTSASGETGAGAASDDASDGDYDLTVDFGLVFPPDRLGVGNVVFVDFDGNGHYDDGEGMGDVVVQLFAQGQTPVSGTELATRTTRPDGTFLFGNLEAGSYYLHIPKSQFLSGAPLFSALSITGSSSGDDNTSEDGIDVLYPESTGVSTGVFTLVLGTSPTDGAGGENGYAYDGDNFRDDRVDLTRDLGFTLRAASPLAVGNLVFNDANANGHLDQGETGIEGVTVKLFHEGDNPLSAPAVGIQQTQSDGTYLFANLTPGRYFVHVPLNQFGTGGVLEGFLSSPGNAGDSNHDDDEDENGVDALDPAATGVSSVVFELADNQEPVEAGYGASADDGDDDNGNLTIDLGFAANCAVLVVSPESLSNAAKDSAYSQTFTLSGTLETPVWTISSGSLPAGMTLSSGGVLSGSPSEAGTFPFDVTAEISGNCQATKSYSLVVIPSANLSVGNTVFVDTDHDGRYDVGEGWSGVQLLLFREGDSTSGPPVQNTSSTLDGAYAFTGLQPGRYFVYVPASQFLEGAPLHQTVSIPGNGKDIGVDDDVDENGIDSATPATTGIRSIVFELSEGGEPLDTTGESGRAGDSDNLADANGDTTIDLGFMASPEVSVGLGNLVFIDANNNHVFDADEGVDGVVVQLFNAADNPGEATPISQVTTANGGRYSFMGLDPGSYKVFIPASQFGQGNPLYGCLSIPGVGANGVADDDVDENGVDVPSPITTGNVSSVVTLALGGQPANNVETGLDGTLDDVADLNTDLTVDLGFARDCHTMIIAPGTLAAGLVDTPYDVQFTASAGIAPYVFTPAFGLLPPGLTLDSSGHLSGTPLAVGTYEFGVQVTDEYGCLTVQPFSLVIASPPLGVGNLIFFDRNGNGHADAGEGVDGVTVELYKSTQTPGAPSIPVDSTVTAGGGRFLFDNLQPDAYLLHIPKGMFAQGEPLWAMKSVPGVLNSGDDESGEDGQDAVDPTLTGVTTMAFNLAPGQAPADTDEPGLDGSSDDARDVDVDLTRDLGFVDATSLPATYTDWLAVHSLTGPGSGPAENRDGDGDSNLLEYALGSDPSSGGRPSDDGFVIAENQVTGQMHVQIRRRHGGQADLTYQVQLLVDLGGSPGGWAPISLVPVVENNGDGTETLTYGPLETDPLFAGASLGFVRVLVTLDANHDTTPEATDQTKVLGWQHRTMVIQHQTYAVPFVQAAAFTGAIDSLAGSTLNVATSAGSASISGMLQTGREYYVEVLGGSLEGHRWEVDEAACTPTTIVLLPADARSTRADIPGTLVGATISLRAHWRVVDLFPVGDFHATLSPNTADTLLFWDNATSAYTTFWLVNAPTGQKWVRVGDASLLSKNDYVIGPCDGLFVRPRVGTVNLGAAGQVRSWDMVCPLKTGVNFVGNPFPMAMSPASRNMTVAGGFKGGANANLADKFNFWSGDASSSTTYVTYYLFKNVSIERWLRAGDAALTDRTNELLFPPTTAAFMTSILGHSTWLIPSPWTP